ncbi:hypothetical protein LIER_22496 [Lithospermum erythrorhizon]|uniref:Uncharacterized protein n=1 Tax=Lithospermum erythrorhizon TaxID=34254 RepID=A0AAV3QZV9_LITER
MGYSVGYVWSNHCPPLFNGTENRQNGLLLFKCSLNPQSIHSRKYPYPRSIRPRKSSRSWRIDTSSSSPVNDASPIRVIDATTLHQEDSNEDVFRKIDEYLVSQAAQVVATTEENQPLDERSSFTPTAASSSATRSGVSQIAADQGMGSKVLTTWTSKDQAGFLFIRRSLLSKIEGLDPISVFMTKRSSASEAPDSLTSRRTEVEALKKASTPIHASTTSSPTLVISLDEELTSSAAAGASTKK